MGPAPQGGGQREPELLWLSLPEISSKLETNRIHRGAPELAPGLSRGSYPSCWTWLSKRSRIRDTCDEWEAVRTRQPRRLSVRSPF